MHSEPLALLQGVAIRASDNERRADILAFAVIAVVIVVLQAARLRTFSMGLIPQGDLLLQFYPLKWFMKQQLFAGHIPLWNPYQFSGHPFLANPQVAMFYPFTALFLLLPLPLAFGVNEVIHLTLAGVGAYLYIRRHTQRRVSALIGAFAFALSGFFSAHLYSGGFPVILTGAWAPLALLTFERALTTRRFPYIIAAAIVLALQVLAGFPTVFLLTALALLLRWLFWIAEDRTLGRSSLANSLIRDGVVAAAIAILAFGLSAVQTLPAWEFVAHSTRAAPDYAFVVERSYHPLNLVTLVIPDALGSAATHNCVLRSICIEASAYVGLLPLLLSMYGLVCGRRKRTLYLATLALLSVCLAVGSHSPIYRVMYE